MILKSTTICRVFLGFLLVYFYLPTLLLGANTLDSLQQRLLQLPEGEEKVKLLNELGYRNYTIDIEKTIQFAQEALDLSEKINYTRGKAEAYSILSIGNSIGGNQDIAYQQLEKTIQFAESIKAYDLIIKACNTRANSLKKEGQLNEALVSLQKGLDLANKIQDDWGTAVIPVSIGGIHYDNGEYSLARTYFRQSIKEATKQNKIDLLSWGYRMLADTYLSEDNLTEARLYFDKALNRAKQAQRDRSIAYCQFSLASIYLKTNKYELAERTALESITLFQRIGDKEGIADVTKILMKTYLASKHPDKAIQFINDNPTIYHNLANIQSNLEIIDLVIEAYVQQKNYKKVYEVGLDLKAIQDSLNLDKKMNLVSELEEKYQLKNKQIENRVLKMEQQKQAAIIKQQKRFNYSLLMVATLLTLLVFTGYKAYFNKRKNNLLLEEKVAERTQALKKSNLQLVQSNKELERFAFVASHDLREPLMNIISFTGLLQKKIDPINDPIVKDFMRFIHENANRMNHLILDTLAFTSLSDESVPLEAVDVNKVILDIQASIANTLNQKKAIIHIAQTLPIIPSNTAMVFSLFKNLIENGIKYNESNPPRIEIDYQISKHFYTFSIADNGIGIPSEFQEVIFEMFKRLQSRNEYQGSGLGLANCKKIVTKMGGKLWVESKEGEGATFYFTVKKESDNAFAEATNKVAEEMILV